MTQFQDLGLLPELQTALVEKNYVEATAIQTQAIPVVLSGKDLMASAQTGTGKTAAFVLPILQRLKASGATRTANRTQVLIITPTRELAAQIYENVLAYSKYLDIRAAVVFGGVNINPQMKTLRGGVDILVATPGRLLDLVGQNAVKLDQVSIFVLDEADRMLDMGFIPDVKRIQGKLPARRHNLMFSATFSDPIRKLAKTMLTDPVEIDVAPRNTTAQNIQQVVHPVDKKSKTQLLIHLIRSEGWRQVLVFSRTKHGANKLVKELLKAGIQSDAIHGNKSQGARTRALSGFKDGLIDILVATDIAARGIDIAALPRVVNFDLPNVPEDYVHRIGRTARAGSSGAAVSLVAADEFKQLRDIERLILKPIERVEVEGFEPGHQVPESGSIPSRPRTNPRQGAPARQGGRNQSGRARAARPKSAGNSHGNTQGASDQSSGNRADGNRAGGNRADGNRADGNVRTAPPKKPSSNRTRSFSPSGRGRPAVNGNR